MPAERTHVFTGSPWEPVVGYARAVRFADWILVSGTTAGSDAGPVGGADIGAQTREALRRIEAALSEAGATLAQVVRTRIYVTDIAQWQAVGHEHGRVFGPITPATTMVEVSGLVNPALLVEIEADAYIG
jgi:enamine deaminase RidA (YjgF/YER057c/UK114 family)